jgi:hypothetical protein
MHLDLFDEEAAALIKEPCDGHQNMAAKLD